MPSPIVSQHRTLYGRFKFQVRDNSNGLRSAAFQTATGLKFNIAKMEYFEGGALAAFKEPARVTFDDLALDRGISLDMGFYDWVKEVVNMLAFAGGGGDISPAFKRDLTVEQMSRDNTPAIEYDVIQAFPVEWSPGDFDNNSDEPSIDMLTLTYYYFDRENVIEQ